MEKCTILYHNKNQEAVCKGNLCSTAAKKKESGKLQTEEQTPGKDGGMTEK